MRRKVSKIGSSTLMISLPSKWCKANNVKKGDEVDIAVQESALSISLNEQPIKLSRTAIDISKLSINVAKRLLFVYHKAGYDEIEIFFTDAKQLRPILNKIQTMLVGYEVIEQSSNRCLIKYLAGEGSPEKENVIRRLFLVLLSFAEECQKAITERRIKDIEELFILEDTINRLSNLIERLINKESNKTNKSIFLYIIIWVLESIGDDYRDLCKHFVTKTKVKPFRHEAKELFSKVTGLLRSYYECYYQFSLEQIDSIATKQYALSKELEEYPPKTDEERILLIYLMKINSRVENLLGSTIGLYI
ncbi:phosphate uptake regulator PhoU [Candidatus Woesearchaeota archaeon]|nr:phosphate uptake regulator PhoU [Candidatus Woesearchaeota archaeon]